MEVRPGYRQTDVGVIPEDWRVMPFIRAVGSYIDYRGRTPRKLGLSWGGGNILALSANNVQMGRIDADKEANVGSEDLYRKWMVQGECEPGDVLLTMEAPLGNVAQIPDSRKYILSQRVVLIKPKDWLLRDFLAHYLKSHSFQKQLSLHSTGSTAKGIQRRRLDSLPIALPSTKVEQKAIAEALSEADSLIESLEQLLAKKRLLKQGAMQELLTGKKRLPGFNGEWVLKRLGEVCRLIVDGTHFTPRYVESGIPFYSVENVTANEFTSTKFISAEEHFQLVKRCKPERGDILLTRIGSIGDTKLIDWNVEASIYVSLALLKIGDHIDAGYLYCYSKCRQFIKDMEDRSLMNASPKKINLRDIGDVPVPVPDRSEQIAIAGILSDMDAELSALKAKLAKARQLKQGMMQELLTGRIRLI